MTFVNRFYKDFHKMQSLWILYENLQNSTIAHWISRASYCRNLIRVPNPFIISLVMLSQIRWIFQCGMFCQDDPSSSSSILFW